MEHKAKFVQINLGRGLAAAELLNKKIREEDTDWALIQEPYHRYRPPPGYLCFRHSDAAKVVTVCKKSFGKVSMLQQYSTDNVLVLKWEGTERQGDILLINVYDEPEQHGRPGKFSSCADEITGLGGKQLIAGDFNAKNPIWGSDISNRRGEELLEWTLEGGYRIENQASDPPTFVNSRGRGWLDLVITKDIFIDNRIVEEEETLSDHLYQSYTLIIKRNKVKKTRSYNYSKANWTKMNRVMLEGQYAENDIEVTVTLLERRGAEAMDKAIPRGKGRITKTTEWWNSQLEDFRRRTRRLRKTWQRENITEQREENKRAFLVARSEYKKNIQAAKQKAMESRLDRCAGDPWGEAYKYIREVRATPGSKNIKRRDGTFTTNEDETTKELIDQYFPKEDRGSEKGPLREIRKKYGEKIDGAVRVKITTTEVKNVIKTLKREKRVSEGSITNECLKHVSEGVVHLLTEIYNACLDAGIFPAVWKKADLVWLPKKDGTLRPISILPAMGRILDKIVAQRISHKLEREGLLHDKQYGFREGRDTVSAVERITRILRSNRTERKHSLVVTLDLANAFNSAWSPAIIEAMKRKGIEGYLINIVKSFLEGRVVTAGGNEYPVERGCPQGSSLGPILWLLVMETWFQKIEESKVDKVEIQAFADDQVIIIAGESVKKLESKWGEVAAACEDWETENKLQYKPEKMEALFVPHRRVLREPTIKMKGETVEIKPHIKYLGVYIDRGLTWQVHVRGLQSRARDVAAKVFYIARRKWGNRTTTLKTIYERAIIPMLLYAAEVWGESAKSAINKKTLRTVERPFLLAITRAYKTAPTAALGVVAGCVPLYIRATGRFATRQRLVSDRNDNTVLPGERLAPYRDGWLPETDWEEGDVCVYTDAAVKEDTRTLGIGLVKAERGDMDGRSIRVEGTPDINVAEALGVRQAIRWAREGRWKRVEVITDSQQVMTKTRRNRTKEKIILDIQRSIQEALIDGQEVRVVWRRRLTVPGQKQADRLAKRALKKDTPDMHFNAKTRKSYRMEERRENIAEWQRMWEGETTGRWTHRLIPTVDGTTIQTTFYITQILTGHGDVKQYLTRFGLTDEGADCQCGEALETMEHVVLHCKLRRREAARTRLAGKINSYPPAETRLREGNLGLVEEWAKDLLLVELPEESTSS